MMKNVKRVQRPKNLPALILQLGLAFVFLYAAVGSLLHPLEWAGFLPDSVAKAVNPTLALRATAIVEIVLALWLVSGRYKKYAAALAAVMLAGIIVANLNQFIVTFRDVGLLCAAVALFFTEA